MNDLIEKLRAILTELGVEPEKIEAAVAALSEDAPVEEEPVVEGNGEEPSTPVEEPVQEEVPVVPEGEVPSEEEGEIVAPQEEVPVDPESVPPVPPEEIVPPVEEGAVPPMPELPPVVSLEEFNAVKTDLEETKKALEGLTAQNQALLEALQSAGVISGSVGSQIGNGTPSLPQAQNSDSTMDDILREINKKAY